jgi:hypothetical protein
MLRVTTFLPVCCDLLKYWYTVNPAHPGYAITVLKILRFDKHLANNK